MEDQALQQWQAEALRGLLRDFYADPANRAAYEEWKKRRTPAVQRTPAGSKGPAAGKAAGVMD